MDKKMIGIIERTPSIAKTILRNVETKEQVLDVVKGLLKAKQYKVDKPKEKEMNMRMKNDQVVYSEVEMTIMAFDRVLEGKSIEEEIEAYHEYFDVLIKDMQKVESEVLKWQKSKIVSTKVQDFLKKYFDLLKELKIQAEGRGEARKFNQFSIQISENIKKLQQIFSSVVSKVVIVDFVEFEREIQKEETKELAVIQTKKLPPMSKVKKDELMVMLKELNLYAYEDAFKILETYVKRYKQDIRFSNELIRMQFKIGKKRLESKETSLDIYKLLGKGVAHPAHPYFPYEEKTEEEFFKALQKDFEDFHEDELSNLTMAMHISRVAKQNRFNFELSEEKKEKYNEIEKLFWQTVEDNLTMKQNWFDKNGKVGYGQEQEHIMVEFEGEQYTLENIYRLVNGVYKEHISTWGKVSGLFFYQGSIIEQQKTDWFRVNTVISIIEAYLVQLKKENEKKYKEKIKEIAQWYPANVGVDPTKRSPLKREVYIDVFIEYLKTKDITEEVAKYITGETYLNFTEHYHEMRMAVRKEEDEFHEKLAHKVLEKVEEEYKQYSLDELLYILRKKTSLNKKGIYVLLKKIKPIEIEQIEEVVRILNEDKLFEVRETTMIEDVVKVLMK